MDLYFLAFNQSFVVRPTKPDIQQCSEREKSLRKIQYVFGKKNGKFVIFTSLLYKKIATALFSAWIAKLVLAGNNSGSCREIFFLSRKVSKTVASLPSHSSSSLLSPFSFVASRMNFCHLRIFYLFFLLRLKCATSSLVKKNYFFLQPFVFAKVRLWFLCKELSS